MAKKEELKEGTASSTGLNSSRYGMGGGYGGYGGYGGMGGMYGGMGGMYGGMGMGGMYGRGMMGMNGENASTLEKAQMYLYQLCEIAQMVEFNAHGLVSFFQTLKRAAAAISQYGKEYSVQGMNWVSEKSK